MGNYQSTHTGAEIDNKLANTYTKTEIDNKLSNIYTKSLIDTNIYTKTLTNSNFYTKTLIDTNNYTKTLVDNLLKVPALLTYTNSAQLSIAASAWNNVTSLTLTPGAWVVSGFTHCSLPSTFQVYLEITTGSTHNYTNAICGASTYYNAANTPDLGCTGVMRVTSNTPVYLWIYGNKAITIAAGFINMRAMQVGTV